MASDTLTVQISPALKEALGIHTGDGVDYFVLLGVSRSLSEEGLVDQGILERSRTLRQWQTSPQYGQEVVKLLTILHRAGKILKDPPRRQAYLQQIERDERGEAASAIEEFTELARAAMADNQLDTASRQELTRFAAERGVAAPEAQRIVAQIRDEMAAKRQAELSEEDKWEFRLAVQGEEGFQMMLHGMEASGEMGGATPESLMGQAAKYGVPIDRAAKLMADFQKARFRAMVRRVAGGGAVSDAQARLLLSKAHSYGLDQEQAYATISDYTLSVALPEDAFKNLSLAETFDSDEIGDIIGNSSGAARRPVRKSFSAPSLPGWARNAAIVGAVCAALIFGGLWLIGRSGSKPSDPVPPPPPRDSGSAATGNASQSPAATPTPLETVAPAQPTPPPEITFEAKPDPPSGVILFAPERPTDPPAFAMAIHEVTRGEYQEFLRATLDTPPAGWNGIELPVGGADMPVTNISWAKAVAYCEWLARQRGWEAQSITLPSQQEYLRALRGWTTRGDPNAPHYWERARLGTGAGPALIKTTQFDKLFVPRGAQMYDLVGNVAEWGRDEKDGRRIVLGGDFTQADPASNPLEARWMPGDTALPSLGMRYVHRPGP